MNQRKGFIFILLSALFFACEYVLLKVAFIHFPKIATQTSAFWGIVVATFIAAPYYLGRAEPRQRMLSVLKSDGRLIVAISLLSAGAAFLWFLAMGESSAGPVALLAKTSILYSFVLGVLVLREPARAQDLAGFALAIGGMAMIVTLSGELPLSSTIYLLTATLLFSFQSLLIKRFARELDGSSFAFLRAAFMSLFMGAGLAVFGHARPVGYVHAIVLGLAVAAGIILGRALYFQAHRYLPISRLNTVLLVEPIIIMAATFALFDEPIGLRKVAGTGLILAGLYFLVGRDWRGGMKE